MLGDDHLSPLYCDFDDADSKVFRLQDVVDLEICRPNSQFPLQDAAAGRI